MSPCGHSKLENIGLFWSSFQRSVVKIYSLTFVNRYKRATAESTIEMFSRMLTSDLLK